MVTYLGVDIELDAPLANCCVRIIVGWGWYNCFYAALSVH